MQYKQEMIANNDKTTNRTIMTHICLAKGSDDELKWIESGASVEEFYPWNITRKTRPGDRAVIYMTERISAFVAIATVGRKIEIDEVKTRFAHHVPHFKVNSFIIGRIQMIRPRIELAKAKERLPEWGYLNHPKIASIPNRTTPQGIVDKFLEMLQPLGLFASTAFDLANPPDRIAVTISRIVRDTELAWKVKQLYAYCCQICGYRIELPKGVPYAESHHIKPLGSPHHGKDEIGNILCLCPNHHAELDYLARDLILSKLHIHKDHVLNQEYIDYHNREFDKKR
jgi:hypothetical protein